MSTPQHATQESLRFPIGRFDPAAPVDAARVESLIRTIAALPARLRAAIEGLDDTGLDRPYRPDGWTIRQVVHHLPDSHLNAYVRWRLGMTEDQPRIRTYQEALWAELPDARSAPVEPSLLLLEGLHDRWVRLLRAMTDREHDRTIDHPEWGLLPLRTMLALYGWHCDHHVAHITGVRNREGF